MQRSGIGTVDSGWNNIQETYVMCHKEMLSDFNTRLAIAWNDKTTSCLQRKWFIPTPYFLVEFKYLFENI